MFFPRFSVFLPRSSKRPLHSVWKLTRWPASKTDQKYVLLFFLTDTRGEKIPPVFENYIQRKAEMKSSTPISHKAQPPPKVMKDFGATPNQRPCGPLKIATSPKDGMVIFLERQF